MDTIDHLEAMRAEAQRELAKLLAQGFDFEQDITRQQQRCSIQARIWSIEEQVALTRGRMNEAADASKMAQKWTERSVHAAKATVADRCARLEAAADKQRDLGDRLGKLKLVAGAGS